MCFFMLIEVFRCIFCDLTVWATEAVGKTDSCQPSDRWEALDKRIGC